MRTIVAALVALVIAVFTVPAAPARAEPKLDVYTTPGVHQSSGRSWKTTCEAYSSTVERCRTELWGTRVLRIGGTWRTEPGWAFNNLTYLPSPRANWLGNPLATNGEHVVNGRRWKTECDTAWTGRGACRSFLWVTTKAVTNGKVGAFTGWVFNNIVMFSGAKTPAVAPSHRAPVGHVLDYRVIGTSREGRPIEAWLVGDPKASTTSAVIGQMHGEERFNNRTAWELVRDPRPITGIKLWVVPTINPDGEAIGRRQNAAGVDLNGNFGVKWRAATGRYATGSGPFSEPESRAIRDFLLDVKPHELVSMHAPLDAVDSYEVKSRSLHDRLVASMGLPSRYLSCRAGQCHGTMTQWINANLPTAAITIEYGYSPTPTYYAVKAPQALIEALGGKR